MMSPVSKTVSIQELGPIIAAKVNSGGTAELTVSGRSMLPLLLDRVSRVRFGAISVPKRGDMILYRRTNGTYVLHRIVKCCDDGTYTICGDGQTVLEPGIRREQMLAVAVAFARRDKWRECTSPPYSLWWRIHVADMPLRRLWKRGMNFLRRIYRKLFSRSAA